MALKYSSSAALLFTEQELGGPCLENESNPTIDTTATTVINGSGDRVGLVMINLGSNNVYVAISSNVSPTNGILLAANGGLLTMTVRDDFTLPSRNWWGIAQGGTSSLYVLEIVRFTALQEST
jgi:hypothetical protein